VATTVQWWWDVRSGSGGMPLASFCWRWVWLMRDGGIASLQTSGIEVGSSGRKPRRHGICRRCFSSMVGLCGDSHPTPFRLWPSIESLRLWYGLGHDISFHVATPWGCRLESHRFLGLSRAWTHTTSRPGVWMVMQMRRQQCRLMDRSGYGGAWRVSFFCDTR
jgi:hypothetical protein